MTTAASAADDPARPDISDGPELQVYLEQRRALIAYAAKVVGSREQAQDIVQDAWLTLAARQDGAALRDPAAYLRTMVRNMAIDCLRQQRRESRLMGADVDNAAQAVADPGASPERTALARRDLDCVRGVLRSLPARQREAIEMHRLGQFKLREVAARLGISVSLAHLLIADGLAACTVRCGIDRIGR